MTTSPQAPSFVYVDDDLPSRKIMQILLTRMMKFDHLAVFEDSANLLSKLGEVKPLPTIFLLDIQMKPHSGYEVLTMLRADDRFAKTTIVAMTANVMAHDVERLKEAGFDGLIGKPIFPESFAPLIDKILAGQSVWFIP